ncbi:hypothetical protein P8C59_008960 [Phyllachora maydis]|uniref:Thioesterase domain-containing protein n=1 Tax=Phyllachora maydis TaxID=1825666 RepID=A0AAD9IBN9_9PEZI|nr:hypothetical protein P8C59_008960 [Phyllachora maydis]
MASKLSPLKFVRTVFKSFMSQSGLEPRLLGPGLRVTNATAGRVELEFDITSQQTNRLGTVHGGTIASMVDFGGSLAVASMGLYATGVSTDLAVTYLSPGGRPGDRLKVTATCDKIGKSLAYTTVTFTNGRGELAARGSHTKFVAKAWEAGALPYVLPEGVEADDVD